jgi:lysyl-tRNA synthetase class 2
VTAPPPVRRRWVPVVAGYGCFAIGLLNIASALTAEQSSRIKALTAVVPGALTHAASAATLVSGVLLLLLAHALRRRKRRAWRAVVTLLSLSVVLHVAKGLDVEEALVALLLLIWLVVYRSEFYALSDPRTRWRALGVFGVLVVVDLVVGGLLLVSQREHVVGSPSFSDYLSHLLLGLCGLPGPLTFDTDRAGDLVTFSLAGLGALTAVVTVYLALRPARPAPQLTADDEDRLRALLAKHGGRDSLGYFALRRDKSVMWSASGKAAVSYRVVAGVMLASGDPIGDPEAWPGAIEAFLDEADRHAWVPAVVGCSELGGQVWAREGGLDALELGDEAVVEICDFSLDGRPMRNVRQMVKRIERAGYTTEVCRMRDVPPQARDDLMRSVAQWRDGETERGFSMALGRFGDEADDDCVLVTAAKDRQVAALLHFVPWGTEGLSLDLMRRDRAADPGLNELLIVAALRAAPALDVVRVSLNFAVFRSALARGERLGAGPVLRGWRAVLLFMSRWFQIESLYRFNAKFRPEWVPRFVVFRNARELPRIGVAALQAEAFIVVPRLSHLGRHGRERAGERVPA